jgi:hypothetical protein
MLNVYNEIVGVDKKNIDTSLFSESSLIYLDLVFQMFLEKKTRTTFQINKFNL